MRQTSIEAYNKIRDNGLLSAKRFMVYEIIAQNGPLNCRQIIEIASRGKVTNTGAISGRLSELESLGVIEEAYYSPCPTTGNNTIFWTATDRLPHKVKKSRMSQLIEKKAKLEYKLRMVDQEIEKIKLKEAEKLAQFRLTTGKYKGKTLGEIDRNELFSWIQYSKEKGWYTKLLPICEKWLELCVLLPPPQNDDSEQVLNLLCFPE